MHTCRSHVLVLSLSLLSILPSLPSHLLLPGWPLYFHVEISVWMLLNLKVKFALQSLRVIKPNFLQRAWARPRKNRHPFLKTHSKSPRHSQSLTAFTEGLASLGTTLLTRSQSFLEAHSDARATASLCFSSGDFPFPAPRSNPRTSEATRAAFLKT